MTKPSTDVTDGSTATDKSDESKVAAEETSPDVISPGLVLAFRPSGLIVNDRARLDTELLVGRSSSCLWCVKDRHLSREHFTVAPQNDHFVVRDCHSHNGVCLNGKDVATESVAGVDAVIRAGACLFVIVSDIDEISPPDCVPDPHIAGAFHSHAILKKLRHACLGTGRHLLIEGEKGTGKELAAKKLHELAAKQGRKGPFLVRDCRAFVTEKDALRALFGARKGQFTGLVGIQGALVTAKGGTLFLDEVHALPLRVQQALLRCIEGEGLLANDFSEPGFAVEESASLVLATSLNVEEAIKKGQIFRNLVAKLHRIRIPPLRRRRADIPSIFTKLLRSSLGERSNAVIEAIEADDIERLLIHDYRSGNVCELQGLVSLIGDRLEEGHRANRALRVSIDECFSTLERTAHGGEKAIDPCANYELHREAILTAHEAVDGDMSKLVEELRRRKIPFSRRWLSVCLDRWGARQVKRRT